MTFPEAGSSQLEGFECHCKHRTGAIYGLWGFMGICIDSIDFLYIQAGIYGDLWVTVG